MYGYTSAQVGELDIDIKMRGDLPDDGQLGTILCNKKSAGSMKIVPLFDIVPRGIKNLDPVAFPIRHIDPPVLIGTHGMNQIKFAGTHPGTAPGEKKFPTG
jgi:hypothetical protein